MSDYSLYFFENAKIDDEGKMVLPIEKFESNLFVQSPFTKIKKNEIIAIENMDLPVEHDFKIEHKIPYNFHDNFMYTKSVKDLIYYDDTKKTFMKNDVEVDKVYIEMTLHCSFAIVMNKTSLSEWCKKYMPFTNSLYEAEFEDIKYDKDFKVIYKLLKFKKDDKTLSKKIEYLEYKDSKYILKERNVLDFDKLKTGGKFLFYIDEKKTNASEFEDIKFESKTPEYPYIELNEQTKTVTYYHKNSKVFHDYYSKEFVENFNTIYLNDETVQDLVKINMYNVLVKNRDHFFKFKYEGSDVISYLEAANFFLLCGRSVLVNRVANNGMDAEANETLANFVKPFNFLPKSQIAGYNSSTKNYGFVAFAVETLTDAVMENNKYSMFRRFRSATYAIDTPLDTMRDNASGLYKCKLFIPAVIGEYLKKKKCIQKYLKITTFPMTELNKLSTKHAGFFKDEFSHFSVITLTDAYARGGMKLHSKWRNVDPYAVLSEELISMLLLSFFMHPVVPYDLKDQFCLQDYNPQYPTLAEERKYKNYYDQSKLYNERNSCSDIVNFSFSDSNLVECDNITKTIQSHSKHFLSTELSPATTIGSVSNVFQIPSVNFLTQDLFFKKDDTKAVLPKQKTDPYTNLVSKNYFMYFSDGDSISYPYNRNNNKKLFTNFSYDNQLSHKIDKYDYVTIKKKEAKTFTKLKTDQNISQVTFEFRDTLGRPFEKVVKENVSLPVRNILVSIGYDNFVKKMKRLSFAETLSETQFTFIHDNSEFPKGDSTPFEFESETDVFPNLPENFDFNNKYIKARLMNVSLPTKPTVNSDESSQYFICVKGCSQVNSILIGGQRYFIIGLLNISKVFDKWKALETKGTRYNFSLDEIEGENIPFPFILTDIHQMNKSEIFVLNSKREIVNYAFDQKNTKIKEPTTPFFLFNFEIYEKNNASV